MYNLPVFRVSPNRPSQRASLEPTIYPTESAKLQDIVTRAGAVQRQGRPVLIGTRSVAASEDISAMLAQTGIEHEVLNARQDRREAEIIARAGRAGQVTVATNMAGRGTDIKIDPAVAAAGGLHVIVAEHNDAGRIDRQLYGRCGRQGDPGSCEALRSWNDVSFTKCAPRPVKWLADNITSGRLRMGFGPAKALMRLVQLRTERQHARLRRRLLKQDQRLDEVFAFSGPVE